MDYFTKKEQIVILVIVLIIISGVGYQFIFKDMIKPKDEFLNIVSQGIELAPDLEDEQIEEDTLIMVHISGQVYKPGIVELPLGKRLTDGIDLAGGLKKDADIDRINLAKKLVDEEKIYIPKVGEEINSDIIDIQVTSDTSSGKTESKTNINKCSLADLESLPGIGGVLSMRIIEYRNSNPFKTIEEIKNVSGIGDKKYDGLKDFIIVK